MLGFSEASERNKAAILAQLQQLFADRTAVLEIGSGSGQHALHMAQALSHLQWQPSEVAACLDTLEHNLSLFPQVNIRPPICLDVTAARWPDVEVDAVFSANTLHIIGWDQVEDFFAGVGQLIPDAGKLAVYGPFRYQDSYTSDSNAQFDGWLQRRDPRSGIRDFEQVDLLAAAQGLRLIVDQAMPANNQLLLWQK